MFKRFSFLLPVFILFLNDISAQTVEWSNQAKTKSKTAYTQILGENSTGVFLVRCRNSDFRKDIVVERYKSNLAIEISNELNIPSGGILEKLVLLENNILFFYSNKNSLTEKVELNCIKLDFNFKPINNPILICEIDPQFFKDNTNFYIKTSADKSKFAVMFIHVNANKYGNSTITFIGLNDQLTITFKKETDIDYEVNDAFFSSIECNNDGDIFSIIDFPKNIKHNHSNDPRNFFVFSYCQSNNAILKTPIGRDSLYINELGLAVNNFNKTVVVTGFYSYKHDNHATGNFFYVLDAFNAKIKTENFEDFSKSFVAKVAASMQNESTPAISDLYIRKIIPKSEGGCLLIAEKYYETKQAYTFYVNGFPQTSYRVVYNFDEIILVSINGDGSLQFKDYLRKTQSSVSDAGYYSSFVTVTGNDKIGIIYNSDVNNESDVMISTISNKGLIDTKVLVKSMSYSVQIMPGESKQVSANSTLICNLKDKRFSIMRLTF